MRSSETNSGNNHKLVVHCVEVSLVLGNIVLQSLQEILENWVCQEKCVSNFLITC